MSVTYYERPQIGNGTKQHFCLLADKPIGTLAKCTCGSFFEREVGGWRVLPKDSPLILAVIEQEG